jgi:hypothetical protein
MTFPQALRYPPATHIDGATSARLFDSVHKPCYNQSEL